MRIKLLDKVKDSHRIVIETEKGPEIVPSVLLFEKGQEIESNMELLPAARLQKLVDYGFAEEIEE